MKRLHFFMRSERGDAWLGLLFAFLFSMILSMIAVSVIQYGMVKGNLKTAANETLQIMKVENGADSKTREGFNELLRDMNMDPSKVSFSATPKTVQRGDKIEITAVRELEVLGLKAIGVEYSVPVRVHVSGRAHKYIREGS
ncbi:DUF4320 family protein [Paenibacillus lautus]|uniref:DUF4320 family protein n=1 Tax=Paenibacillus lautus TaxID=1401 RepID=UPI003D28DFC7